MNIRNRLYKVSPIVSQNLLVSIAGASLRLRRTSDKELELHRTRLLQSEYIDLELRQIEASRRLKKHLSDSVRRVPFYRDSLRKGSIPNPEEFEDPFEALRCFPLLEKSSVRGSEYRFLRDGVPKRQIRTSLTSGTTGTPIRIFETQQTLSLRFAFVARLRSWAGLENALHPRRAQFTGKEIAQSGVKPSRRNFADSALLLSTTHITHSTFRNYFAAIDRFRPLLMDGYPTAMFLLAKLANLYDIAAPTIPTVITTAETLTDDMRLVISQTFGSKVFNQYAMTEPSCFWSDCEFGVLHVHSEYGVSEIIGDDGQEVAPGERGEVVVTSLINDVMPLIRYRTGDFAVKGISEECKCGRTLPRVERIDGRSEQVIFTSERGFVGRLDPVFKGLEGLIEAQIVQETLTDICVRAVVDDRVWTKQLENQLVVNLKDKLGSGQSIRIEECDSIERSGNGKFLPVVSLCRREYPIDVDPYLEN